MTDTDSRFALISLGCPKNLVDSEYICQQMIAAGWSMENDPGNADTVIVNTCAFLTSAVEESIQTILDYIQQGKNLVAAGCMVSRYRENLLAEIPEVVLFAAPGAYAALPGAIKEKTRYLPPDFHNVVGREFISTGATAYVKISEGCSNHCCYCLIPHLRGELLSKPIDAIARECDILVSKGVREIILVGQDLGSYGKDAGLTHDICDLVERLTASTALPWLRLMYVHPASLTPRLIELIAQHPKVCSYLDIPVQHVSDSVLARMGRKGGRAAVMQALEALRAAGVWIRSTVMVGHPGEDAAAFAELEACVQAGMFDSLGAFAYSPEEGTASAALPQLDDKLKQTRLKRIMSLQRSVSRRKLKTLVGTRQTVILEGFHDETELLLKGRASFQAPEVDGIVMINDGSGRFGDMVEVAITSSTDYDLVGGIL